MPLPVATTPSQSDRLNDVRGRLSELRQRRNRAQEHVAACKQALTAQGGQPDVNSEPFRRAENALRDLSEIQGSIALTEQEEHYVLSAMAGVDGGIQRESFLREPTVLEDLRQRAESSQPIGDLNLGVYKDRDSLMAEWQQRRMMAAAGDVTLPSDAARTTFYGITPPILRPLRLIDLLPTQPMEVGSFSYLQQSSSANNAAETGELTTKPTAAVTTTDAVCKAQTIPEWVRVSRNVLADVPGLATVLEAQLQNDVEARLDSQILNGSGTGNNLTGILAASGIGAPASVAGDANNADLVLNGAASVISAYAVPNGIVMNYTDVVKALKARAAGSGEREDSDGAFAAIPTTLWGLPLVVSPSLAVGTALVGDFARGATLFLRQGYNVRISDSDSGDFTSNAIKILGELRAGLAIWRPSFFARVTLTFSN